MASKRLARLNEQLKRELAELIQTELRDPRVGLVSVTAVQVASDLGSARVFIRALGGDAERAECLEGLVAAAPYLRKLLGQILQIRRIPELRFQEDRTLEQARRIEDILAEVLPPHGADVDEDVDGDIDGDVDGQGDAEGDGDGAPGDRA
jgi:ribosome-binding factor A